MPALRQSRIASLCFVASSVPALLVSPGARAADIFITPADSIQTAINSANSGDRIVLAPGVYTQSFGISNTGKTLTLEGAGPEQTILDGQNAGRIAGLLNNGAPVHFRGMTFRNGRHDFFVAEGGAILSLGTLVSFENCRFINNIATGFSEPAWGFGGAVSISYSDSDAPILIVDCEFIDNIAETRAPGNIDSTAYGGAIKFTLSSDASAIVRRTRFQGNTAENKADGITLGAKGGAVAIEAASGGPAEVEFDSCVFVANAAVVVNHDNGYGGAVGFIGGGLATRVTGCLFQNNSACFGGAINARDQVDVLHSTFALNSACASGGAIHRSGGVIDVRNSIFALNTAPSGPELAGAFEHITHSLVGAPGGFSAAQTDGSLFDAAPMFVNAAAANFRLAPGSPCIDAADTSATVAASILADLAGAPRAVDDPSAPNAVELISITGHTAAADMGAYERQPRSCDADLTGDGAVTSSDLALLLTRWGLCP